jgi:hypothetical protein
LHYTANGHCGTNGIHERPYCGILLGSSTSNCGTEQRLEKTSPFTTAYYRDNSQLITRPQEFKLFVSDIAAIPENDKIQPFARASRR